MNDANERSCAARGSCSIWEHFRFSVQAGLFDSLKSIHTANVLLKTVILPAFDEVPTLTDEEREAIEAAQTLAGLEAAATHNENNEREKEFWNDCKSTLRLLLERTK